MYREALSCLGPGQPDRTSVPTDQRSPFQSRPVHEAAIHLHDRIIDDQAAIKVSVQGFGIDFLPFGVDPSRKVMDAYLVSFEVGPQSGFHPLALGRCHEVASQWLVAASHK